MSLGLRQRIEALRQARRAVRAALEAHTGANPADAERLTYLRTVVESFAKQTDALIAMTTTGRGALSGQVSEAEDLRAYFRLVVGCIEARLDAGPGDGRAKGSARQVLNRHPRKTLPAPRRGEAGRLLEVEDAR